MPRPLYNLSHNSYHKLLLLYPMYSYVINSENTFFKSLGKKETLLQESE
jgi:hypothetical protein